MTQDLASLGAVQVSSHVWRIRNQRFASNTYVAVLDDPADCVIIDPGLDLDTIEAVLQSLGTVPVAVVCTHAHFDHIGSAAPLQERYSIPVHLHPADRKLLSRANFIMMICKVEGRIDVPRIDVELSEGTDLDLGGRTFRVLHTPGHTPGSCLIIADDVVFTGDTIFRDSSGVVNFPGEDVVLFRESVSRAWDALSDSMLVCPGHGQAGLVGDIKRDNRALRDFLRTESTTPARSQA